MGAIGPGFPCALLDERAKRNTSSGNHVVRHEVASYPQPSSPGSTSDQPVSHVSEQVSAMSPG